MARAGLLLVKGQWMPYVKFTETFFWSPPELNHRLTIRYLKGKTYLVTTACFQAALKDKSGIRVRKPGTLDHGHVSGGVFGGG